MTLAALRDHLRLNAGFNGCPALLCIVGDGKPALATLRETIDARLLPILQFDVHGTPTEEEMTRCWESPRGWQKSMTYYWVHTARTIFRMRPLVVLHGAFDPQYAIAACAANRVRQRVVLLAGTPATPEWIENTRSLGGTVLDAATPRLADTLATIALELVTAST